MYRLLLYSILFCCTFFPKGLHAAHIIGGEITYECLGYTNGDSTTNSRTYQFYMKIYRDCLGGGANFDSANFSPFDASVTIFQGNNSTPLTVIYLDAPQVTAINPNPNNPCLILPSNVCVQEGLYTFPLIDLPIIEESYYFVYQRCCRNNSISNLVAPGDAGATYFMELTPLAQSSCNNSPVFNDFPPIVICADDVFNFDHSASDAEGDQLVYEFCSPLLGGGPNTGQWSAPFGVAPDPDTGPPYSPVNFIPVQYDPLNPLGNSSDISIDVNSGIITGTPALSGQFVVGVCVYEYRNGQLLSVVRRDFQFNVTSCQPRVIAAVQAEALVNEEYVFESCGETVVNFPNESYDRIYIDDFRWEFQINGRTETFTEWEPRVTFPGEGQYQGRLLLNPGTECGDTATVRVSVLPNISADFRFEYDTCAAEAVQFYDESFSGSGLITNWSWEFEDNRGSSNPNPSHLFLDPGVKNVQLTVRDANNCLAIISKPVRYFPVPTLPVIAPSAFEGCVPATIFFDNLSSPVDDTYTLDWQFGDGNISGAISPVHQYETDGIFSVSLEITSPIGCKTDTIFPDLIAIDPAPIAGFSFTPTDPDVFNSEVNFIDESTGGDRWYWNFDSEATSILQNPSYIFRDTGLQEVVQIVTHPNGCQDSMVQIVDVFPTTTFFMPNAFTPNGDAQNDAFRGVGYLKGYKSFRLIIWNRWGEKVFETNDPTEGWNGQKFNMGRMSPAGVYVYHLSYTLPRGTVKEWQGVVTLVN